MLNYLLLVASTCMVGSNSVFFGIYNRKNEGMRGASALCNLIFAMSALVCWGFWYLSDLSFDLRVLPYAVGFGLSYCCGCTGYLHALRYGPVSVTTLLVQLSSVATAIWGALFWDMPLNTLSVIGLCLVVAAMALCIQGKREKQTQKMPFSFKWLFFVLLSFCGNGFCIIFQRSQVIAFTNEEGKLLHGGMMMFFGMVFAVLFLLLVWLKTERERSWQIIRKTGYLPVITGLNNFGANMIIQYLAVVKMPPAVQYPIYTLGCLSLTAILSRICFKERLYWWQWLGMAIGAAASIVLSLA